MSTVVLGFFTALQVAASSADLSATCASLDADQHGACSRPRQGHAMLQVRSVDAALQSAGTPSSRLIDNLFGGSSGKRMHFDLALIERALSRDEPLPEQSDYDLAGWIKSALLPQAEVTKSQLQGEVNRALKAVQECDKLNWHAEKSMAHRERLLASDESDKYQCIAQEHQLSLDSRTSCAEVDAYAKNSVQPATLKETDLNDREAINMALEENRNFFKEAYPQYDNLNQECEKATLALANQQKECEVDDAVVREFYCHMKAGRDKACVGYTACYEEKKGIFDKIVFSAKKLEAENKNHFQKLACASSADEHKVDCQGSMNTGNLDVSYPEDPGNAKCIAVAKTKYDYSDIRCNEDGTVDDGEEESSEEEGNSDNSTKPVNGNSTESSSEPASSASDEPAAAASNASTSSGNATAASLLNFWPFDSAEDKTAKEDSSEDKTAKDDSAEDKTAKDDSVLVKTSKDDSAEDKTGKDDRITMIMDHHDELEKAAALSALHELSAKDEAKSAKSEKSEKSKGEAKAAVAAKALSELHEVTENDEAKLAKSEKSKGEAKSTKSAKSEKSKGEATSTKSAKSEKSKGEEKSTKSAKSEKPKGEEKSTKLAKSEKSKGEAKSTKSAKPEKAKGAKGAK